MARVAPLAVSLAAMLALSGCSSPADVDLPDAFLPGIRTETDVETAFRCGALLFPQGCVIVQIDRVESGCAGEVGGYARCNATIEWSAASGAVEPGSSLRTAVAGVEGPSCDASPMLSCHVNGTVASSHRFSAPGQNTTWSIPILAWLEAPAGSAATTGEFSLTMTMVFRTEDEAALTS